MLSLVAAGIMSSALAQEVPNLANIAPSNYGSYVPMLDFYVKGKDITDSMFFCDLKEIYFILLLLKIGARSKHILSK